MGRVSIEVRIEHAGSMSVVMEGVSRCFVDVSEFRVWVIR
jgi:hypothetical protein